MLRFPSPQKTLFNLKELESRLSKEKGIVSQAVQGLLDELVADNLIEKDKIGSGNFFWCFPSKAVTSREAKLTAQLQQADALTETIQGLQNRKRRTHEGREDTPERTAVLAQLAELKYVEARRAGASCSPHATPSRPASVVDSLCLLLAFADWDCVVVFSAPSLAPPADARWRRSTKAWPSTPRTTPRS